MKKIAVFTLALLAAMPLAAQKRAFTIEDIYRLQYASGPTVSATGALAYGTSRSDLKAQKSYSNIVVNGKTITTDNKSFSPFWSADGRTLYYVSMASGSSQLYAWHDGKATQLTDYAARQRILSRHISPIICSIAIGRNTATGSIGTSSSIISRTKPTPMSLRDGSTHRCSRPVVLLALCSRPTPRSSAI